MDESLAEVVEERDGLRRIIGTYRQLQQTHGDAPTLTANAKALRCAIDASDIRWAERVLARIRSELGDVKMCARAEVSASAPNHASNSDGRGALDRRLPDGVRPTSSW
jgi:hypothetical protein